MSKATPCVLIIIENSFEDMELMYPRYRLQEAGYQVIVAGPRARQEYVGKHGQTCTTDASIFEVDESDLAGVICPGGWSPDRLRRHERVKSLVVQFHNSGKLVASICHGAWILISSRICNGVRMTGSPGLKDDLVNAGAIYEDSPVVIDRNVVTSRRPDDLPNFMKGVLQVLGQGTGQGVSYGMREVDVSR